MKKYIRALVANLNQKRNDYVPPVPSVTTKTPVFEMDQKPPAPAPFDLDNQILSKDPAERVRQLDFQAQRLEQDGTMPG